MRPGIKMLMLSDKSRERGTERGKDYGESNYGRMGYDGASGFYAMPEGNYSGRNNRSNYTRNEYENEMRDMDARFQGGERSDYRDYERMNYGESRRRFPRREDGTFAPRSEMGYPYIPPVYEREDGSRMNLIGFERRDELSGNYGMRAEQPRMYEMEQRHGQMQMGRGQHEMKLTREMAEEWMMGLENEDGTKGPHWSMDQARQVMQQRGIEADPATYWAVLNMMYSDYCKVFKKHGVGDRVDFYADMAAAWINDRDADPKKKTAAYYQYVVSM